MNTIDKISTSILENYGIADPDVQMELGEASAPAHHFGSAKGLLTEVALLAFERLDRYIEEVGHSDDVVTDVAH